MPRSGGAAPKVGIETINLYGCSLYLSQERLALARGKDPLEVVSSYLIDARSVNPPYEDTVTMGANAARPLMDAETAESIGLLVVGTEGGLDFGKPISTHLHDVLGLGTSVRNFEVKHACYSGVAALDTALNWIGSGANRGKKALVIATDFSRQHFGEDHEFVLGGAAVAAVISDTPKVLRYDLAHKGIWTSNVYDTWRPTARAEMGNNTVSLYTYLDALEGAFTDYTDGNPEGFDFRGAFARNIYHMPFPGMAFQAHRKLFNLAQRHSKEDLKEDYQRRVAPSLTYARQVGSQYSSSNFVGLCGLIDGDPTLQPEDRVGFFAYGSGAIGEFYAGTVEDSAHETLAKREIGARLSERREVTHAEYEAIETARDESIELRNYTPDFSILDNWYRENYQRRGLLVLDSVNDFQRCYRWS